VDSAKVDTIDYADLSDADLIRMALEEGELAFEAAVGRRRPTSRKLHLRLCLRTDAGGWDLDGGDTTQRFINQRLWTSEDTLDRNTYGKALICSMYLMNSDAARALRYEIPAGVIYTTGGVYARLEEPSRQQAACRGCGTRSMPASSPTATVPTGSFVQRPSWRGGSRQQAVTERSRQPATERWRVPSATSRGRARALETRTYNFTFGRRSATTTTAIIIAITTNNQPSDRVVGDVLVAGTSGPAATSWS
jgi:hypothetical protein